MSHTNILIRFKCELVEENTTIETNLVNISKKEGCHLKGFALRIDKLDKPIKFINHLETFNLISWDGDDLDENSMTKFIPIVCSNKIRLGNDIPKLWTIKYEEEKAELLNSWNNKICLIDDNHMLNIINDNNYIDNIDENIINEVIIYYSIMNEDLIPNEKYLHSSIKMHLKTQCLVCIIIGGGNGLKQEHIVTQNHNKICLNSEIAVDYENIKYNFISDPLISLGVITWYCYPLSRITDGKIENCFFHDYENKDNFIIMK